MNQPRLVSIASHTLDDGVSVGETVSISSGPRFTESSRLPERQREPKVPR